MKDLLRADREGNWELHLDSLQRALFEFSAWDSTNYLHCAGIYLEDARRLPETHPVRKSVDFNRLNIRVASLAFILAFISIFTRPV